MFVASEIADSPLCSDVLACQTRVRARDAEPSVRPEAVNVTRDEVKAGIAAGTLVLVDVREPHEFVQGHIPGAISMPLSQFEPEQLARLDLDKVIFSCAAGVRSMHAIMLAQAAGLDLSRHYRGGFGDWMMSGEPVETGA